MSLLESVASAENTSVEVGVAMLKKAQDMTKQQGAAMIRMLEQSVVSPDGRRIDAYA